MLFLVKNPSSKDSLENENTIKKNPLIALKVRNNDEKDSMREGGILWGTKNMLGSDFLQF